MGGKNKKNVLFCNNHTHIHTHAGLSWIQENSSSLEDATNYTSHQEEFSSQLYCYIVNQLCTF